MYYTADLADAIVTFLGTQDLGEDVTIQRRRLVLASLEDMKGTTVSVIPFGTGRSLAAEGVHEVSPDIRLVVQAKLTQGAGEADTAASNAAAKLAEDIAGLLVGTSLLVYQCQSAKLTPSYDPTKLSTLDVFDAMIVTTWSTFEDGPDA